jgi:Arc/MetJ-type ribon-helix-helix transcriptional regulator
VATKRVIVSMPDRLIEALNRATADSPKSRSEIVCEAVEKHLGDHGRLSEGDRARVSEDTFFDRVAEMMESGLLKPEDFASRPDDPPDPKDRRWIN